MTDTCGYALVDDEGEMYPCDRPVTGWRWYQDVGEHEDMLDTACSIHENEGGRRIHDAESHLAKVEALADKWAALGDTDSAFWWSTLAAHIRYALEGVDL